MQSEAEGVHSGADVSSDTSLAVAGSTLSWGHLGVCGLSNYKTAKWVSERQLSSSFSPKLSIPMLVTGGTLLSDGSAVRVGVEQYKMKPTMMTVKDRM